MVEDERRDGADTGAPNERMQAVGERSSAVVREAAEVLQEELSAGIEEARRLQQRFTERRQLERGDLDEVAERLRRNAHQLIDMLTERFRELQADDVQALGSQFAKDAHQVLDGVMDLVDVAPDVVNSLSERLGAVPEQRDSTS